jgi:hypothetical protein
MGITEMGFSEILRATFEMRGWEMMMGSGAGDLIGDWLDVQSEEVRVLL